MDDSAHLTTRHKTECIMPDLFLDAETEMPKSKKYGVPTRHTFSFIPEPAIVGKTREIFTWHECFENPDI